MAQPLRKLPDPSGIREAEENDDLFRFGFRTQFIPLPDGDFEARQVPLTVEDLLDPQIGDHVVQGYPHGIITMTLAEMLIHRYRSHDDVLVGWDAKIFWGIPGLPNPAPDVSVIRGVRDKRKARDSFNVPEEGVGPCFVLEVVSPARAEYRENDHKKKVRIYERAGVGEYVILDQPRPATNDRFRLTGYRLDAQGRYQRIEPDGRGRLFAETLNLWFEISEDGQKALLIDAETGERLLTAEEARSDGDAAKEAQGAAEAELARLREELARLKGSSGR
jgi:Uma2 family endonuclease